MVATLLKRWLTHYWNGGYTIEMVATLLKKWLTHYSNGGYTIGIVAIIFLYKLISSSFVIIPSHTSLREREKGEGRELK